MNSPHFPEKDMFALELKDYSLASLLERGLKFAKQGQYAEGAVLFALAREHVPPQQRQLIDVLNVFINDYTDYWQVQQTLQQASKRFVEIETTQQDTTMNLEKFLLTLRKDISSDVNNGMLSLSDQHSLIQQPQPSSNDTPVVGVPSLSSSHTEPLPQMTSMLAPLHFTCFGRFEVRQQNQPLVLCTNRNGQTILRYLVTQPEHSATMDALMTELWTDDEQEVAHHKLQVAVSALRRSLNNGYECSTGAGYILCKQGTYQLNPSVSLHSDVDEFISLYQAGQRATHSSTIAHYEKACFLYTGPFLPEDLYADWSSIQREQLSRTYLTMCGVLLNHYIELCNYEQAIMWATAILKENRCDEDAYRQLMHIYAVQGRRSEALRQYHRCRQVLSEELGVEPMPETIQIFHSLLNGDIPFS